MAAPPIGILLDVFVCQCRLKGTAMQVQLEHIASGERVLWQICEEEFVHNTCACYPNRTLLLPAGCVATTTRQGTPSGPTGIAGQS
jgi:hypothetical protein